MAASKDVPPSPTFPIARISSSHDFADLHDHLRRPMSHATKMGQNMTIIISISPEPLQRSPHKFVNVMASRLVRANMHRRKFRRFIVSHRYDYGHAKFVE
ncbi:hypothetical protein [Bradyrhizobium guangdongense]|uniref:hypothetical protein n=1 Tax=Bradyrhizobium guangdongense TaxID=1325090 RepID=UPI00131A083D|nr:hypothetical protein [Bradyrhizobium guangdongense]